MNSITAACLWAVCLRMLLPSKCCHDILIYCTRRSKGIYFTTEARIGHLYGCKSVGVVSTTCCLIAWSLPLSRNTSRQAITSHTETLCSHGCSRRASAATAAQPCSLRCRHHYSTMRRPCRHCAMPTLLSAFAHAQLSMRTPLRSSSTTCKQRYVQQLAWNATASAERSSTRSTQKAPTATF